MDFNELKNLSVAEKLKLVELLWDDIGALNVPIELQPWQFEEAASRSKQLEADPSISIDRNQLWQSVDG